MRESIDRELAQISDVNQPVKKKLLKRKSIDGIIGMGQTNVGLLRRKHPSEKALNITDTYENLLIDDGGREKPSERKKGRTGKFRRMHWWRSKTVMVTHNVSCLLILLALERLAKSISLEPILLQNQHV